MSVKLKKKTSVAFIQLPQYVATLSESIGQRDHIDSLKTLDSMMAFFNKKLSHVTENHAGVMKLAL